MALGVYASHFTSRKTPLPLDPSEHPLVALQARAGA
jgi:hypothetical protein